MRFAVEDRMGAKRQKIAAVALDLHPAWRTPVNRQLQGLFGELAAFNER
jgi:hypothetical protein